MDGLSCGSVWRRACSWNHRSSQHARIRDRGAGGPRYPRFSNNPHSHSRWVSLVVFGLDEYIVQPRSSPFRGYKIAWDRSALDVIRSLYHLFSREVPTVSMKPFTSFITWSVTGQPLHHFLPTGYTTGSSGSLVNPPLCLLPCSGLVQSHLKVVIVLEIRQETGLHGTPRKALLGQHARCRAIQ